MESNAAAVARRSTSGLHPGTALVLGSDGFIGRALTAHLERQGSRVRRFDVSRTSEEDARCVNLPLSDVDRVFFLAWDVGGAKYLYRSDTQVRQLEWNVPLLENVMRQLSDSELPFVFASSQLARDTDTAYGVCKRLGEVWTRHVGGSAVRLWNAYGSLEPMDDRSHVISDLVWQAVVNGEIRLLTDGSERRRFVHLDDIAAGLDLASTEAQGSDVPFDLASLDSWSIREAAVLISEATGARVVPGQAKGAQTSIEEFTRLPGWSVTVDFRDGLRRMVEAARLGLPR